MGVVITISRQYGSDGRTVGLKAAESLGYLYVDKELIVEVARQAEVPVSEVERFDEHPGNTAVRVLKKLLVPEYNAALLSTMEHGWVPYGALPDSRTQEDGAIATLDEDTYVRLTQEAMLRLADQEDVVLIGRGGQAFLAGRSDVLHARVVAPDEFRVETAVERDGCSREEAIKQIRKVDEERRIYIKRHYGMDWDAPEHYHLFLNTGWMGVDAAARLLVEAHNTF